MTAGPKSLVTPHTFVLDERLSEGDPLRRAWCARCGMPGRPNFGRHRKPTAPAVGGSRRGRRVDAAAAAEWDRRRLGERER